MGRRYLIRFNKRVLYSGKILSEGNDLILYSNDFESTPNRFIKGEKTLLQTGLWIKLPSGMGIRNMESLKKDLHAEMEPIKEGYEGDLTISVVYRGKGNLLVPARMRLFRLIPELASSGENPADNENFEVDVENESESRPYLQYLIAMLEKTYNVGKDTKIRALEKMLELYRDDFISYIKDWLEKINGYRKSGSLWAFGFMAGMGMVNHRNFLAAFYEFMQKTGSIPEIDGLFKECIEGSEERLKSYGSYSFHTYSVI